MGCDQRWKGRFGNPTSQMPNYRTINIMSNSEKVGSEELKIPVSTLPLFTWLERRSAGMLLHPTSLPNDQGIGVLNGAVNDLFDFMMAAGISQWQVCPLGPTGYGDSPYQCFSVFAGNPYLIDLQALVRAALLNDADVAPLRALPAASVDFGWLYVTKWPALQAAFERFVQGGRRAAPYGDFAAFRAAQAAWLEPYCLFLALKGHFKRKPWWQWPAEVRFHHRAKKTALAASPAIVRRAEAHAFFQYLFFGQWTEVRAQASARGITIIGDAPIFVARDSADAWTHPELFDLDQSSGKPRTVAGVPPDYFSADGQLWGNPLYDWAAHAEDGYAWWLRRLEANFALYDVLRIDHFRAFDSYWAIPADAATARTGKWKRGPGLAFFAAVRERLLACRMIAEDLGDLNADVVALRDATGLPGMTILQFAFGSDATNLYLPHNLAANSVVYPGTHDNDTTLGWYVSAPEKTRDHVRRYLRVSGDEISWDFIRAAYGAVSRLAVLPLQDLLGLGSEARFNTPGSAVGNWGWRYDAAHLATLHRSSAAYLRELGELNGRRP